jgi:hypothetical protein
LPLAQKAEGAGSGHGAIAALQPYASAGYCVDGRKMPARARVTGPMGAGAAAPEWPLEGDAVDEAAPELELEGDAGGVDGAAPEPELEGAAVDSDGAAPKPELEGAAEDGDGATPELGLEGDAGGVGRSAPERGLEGDDSGVDVEAPELELEGAVDATGVDARCRGVPPVDGGEDATCSCANGMQCSSKYMCRDVMTQWDTGS